jgi:uncharacterized membrane protein HdeD (DUF308 family)
MDAGQRHRGFAGTAAWAIGLIVGVNLLFGGTALIAVAVQARANRAPATI